MKVLDESQLSPHTSQSFVSSDPSVLTTADGARHDRAHGPAALGGRDAGRAERHDDLPDQRLGRGAPARPRPSERALLMQPRLASPAQGPDGMVFTAYPQKDGKTL